MKLKELKQSLAKFGGDFDDCEVFISYKDAFGHEDYDLVAATGHDKSMEFICLIGLRMVDKHLENPVNKKFKNKKNDS